MARAPELQLVRQTGENPSIALLDSYLCFGAVELVFCMLFAEQFVETQEIAAHYLDVICIAYNATVRRSY